MVWVLKVGGDTAASGALGPHQEGIHAKCLQSLVQRLRLGTDLAPCQANKLYPKSLTFCIDYWDCIVLTIGSVLY